MNFLNFLLYPDDKNSNNVPYLNEVIIYLNKLNTFQLFDIAKNCRLSQIRGLIFALLCKRRLKSSIVSDKMCEYFDDVRDIQFFVKYYAYINRVDTKNVRPLLAKQAKKGIKLCLEKLLLDNGAEYLNTEISIRDLMNLSHPKPKDDAQKELFKFYMNKATGTNKFKNQESKSIVILNSGADNLVRYVLEKMIFNNSAIEKLNKDTYTVEDVRQLSNKYDLIICLDTSAENLKTCLEVVPVTVKNIIGIDVNTVHKPKIINEKIAFSFDNLQKLDVGGIINEYLGNKIHHTARVLEATA